MMRIVSRPAQLVLVVTLSSWLPALVKSDGTLFLQFVQYNNQDSRCADGTYCDPVLFFDIRESPCDPRFRLTADRYNPGGSSMYDYQQPGSYGDQDVINFGSVFAEMANPVPFAMNYADNNGKIYITVTVTDKDTTSDDLIDVFSATLDAIGTDVKSVTMTSSFMGHTLSLRYWYVCHPNFYGSLCNTFCLAQDSVFGGHYTCNVNGEKVCRSGWVGASTDCKTPHPCNTGVCQNGATCVPIGESYTCQCPADFAGTSCELFRDPCVYRNPCVNGGQCVLDATKQSRCRCPPQFTGDRCDVDVDECAVGMPCSNGMPCINTFGSFSCNCTDAKFIGDLCEIDRCNGTVCENNGTCLMSSTDGSPKCYCPAGFTGKFCETPIPCYSSPCQNGATCSNNATADVEFTCTCPPEFYGSLCETVRPDHCASGPCRNGGNCSSGDSGFSCDCPPGFKGPSCEERTGATAPSISADRLLGNNPGDTSASEASTSVSMTGVAAGCVIGFLLLAGAVVFLAIYLLRRRSLAESLPEDGSSSGFSNAVYNNASVGGEIVRSHEVPSVNLEADAGDVYEAIGGDPVINPQVEQVGYPAGVQVNQAYEVDA